MRFLAAVAALAMIGGCVTRHRVVVRGKALHAAVPELERGGRVTVAGEDIHDDHERGRKFEVELAIDQPIGAGDERKPVRDWIVDCSAASGRCALDIIGDAPIEVRRFETRSAKPVIAGTVGGLVGGTLIGSIICGFACADGSDAKQASKYILIGEGVLIGAGLVYLLIRCYGQRACRD